MRLREILGKHYSVSPILDFCFQLLNHQFRHGLYIYKQVCVCINLFIILQICYVYTSINHDMILYFWESVILESSSKLSYRLRIYHALLVSQVVSRNLNSLLRTPSRYALHVVPCAGPSPHRLKLADGDSPKRTG